MYLLDLCMISQTLHQFLFYFRNDYKFGLYYDIFLIYSFFNQNIIIKNIKNTKFNKLTIK